VVTEGGHGGRVESDRAAALCRLRLGNQDLVVDNHARAAGRHASGVQVDVDPTKSGRLSPSHAGGGEQQPGGVQPVGSDMIEEDVELLRAPDMHLRCRAPRKVGHSSNVAGDIPPAHRVPERGMQGAMDVADCLRRQAAPSIPMPVSSRPL
jgi:hypothetical protein